MLARVDHLGGHLVQDLRNLPRLGRRQVGIAVKLAEDQQGVGKSILSNLQLDLLHDALQTWSTSMVGGGGEERDRRGRGHAGGWVPMPDELLAVSGSWTPGG